jgi:hypothetical protein
MDKIQVGEYQSDPATFEGMIEMADIFRTKLKEHLAQCGMRGEQLKCALELAGELEKWSTLAAIAAIELME